MPASSLEDNILLRLVVKGMEPGEASRVSRMTATEMEAELNASLARQVSAHKAAADAQGATAQKAAKAEVREALDKTREVVGALQIMEREQARAARGMSSNWRRVAEDLENLTVVATGAWGIIAGGAGRLKALGDSVAQTTNIYGSLKGSIDEMREASRGQIADIDLITTKNRAAQKELQLTDEQFGLVAASADVFADALGTSTKDALDGLIDGLATGRTRSLAMAGVVIDESQAYEAYAKKVNVATDKLSEHDKLVAKVEASLRAMDKKLAESAGGVENFGDKWDVMNAKVSNLADEMKLSLGGAITSVIDLLFEDLPSKIAEFLLMWQVTFAKAADLANKFNPLAKNTNYAAGPQAELQGLLQNRANGATAAAEMAAKQVADARDRQRRDTNPQMSDLAMFGGKGLPYDASAAVGRDTTRGQDSGKAAKVELTGLQRLFAAAIDAHPFDQEATDLANQAHDAIKAKMEEVFGEKSLFTAEEQEKILSRPWEKLPDKTMGTTFLEAMGWDISTDETDALIQNQTDRILADRDAALERIKGANRGSIGMFSFLFGDDFLEKTREEMSEVEREMADTAKNMGDSLKAAGREMTGALGHSIAAAIGEGKSFKAVLKDTTHAALMSISERAFGEALWEGAMALKDLAMYNFPGAALHGAAAAEFGVVAAATGIGARATYSAPASGASSAPTSQRASSSSGSSGSSSDGSGAGSVTLIVNSMFGDKASVARAVNDALADYKQITGRDIGVRA